MAYKQLDELAAYTKSVCETQYKKVVNNWRIFQLRWKTR